MSGEELELLTVQECAKELRCSAGFVRNLIGDSELKYVKVGKRHMVTRGDLNRWIERARRYADAEEGEVMAVKSVQSRSK